MTMRIVTFLNDGNGGTKLGYKPVELHGPENFLSGTSLMMSDSYPCKRYFFSEIPPGYSSSKDFSSRRQLCVLLSGEIELTSSTGDVQNFVAGNVILLEDVDYERPGRTIRITSEYAARVLAIQLD
ncbi:hypothetical protein HAT86_15155 [Roseovarius gahaiensis]|uniref:Uncharacterized protein n=1 Tax=Roseovarius gahaiensis TaxID=2716691 RepID=A0A967BEK0_9RHOB|nr:hypothetical protein [Roseovarius gahaiensis]NHQ75789.1 hypothetical protein [Roseovarius gahaiensis]